MDTASFDKLVEQIRVLDESDQDIPYCRTVEQLADLVDMLEKQHLSLGHEQVQVFHRVRALDLFQE